MTRNTRMVGVRASAVRSVAVAVLVCLLLQVVLSGSAGAESATTDELTNVAWAALAAENQALTSENAAGILPEAGSEGSTLTGAYAEAMAERVAKAADRSLALRAVGIRYDGFTTELTPSDLQVEGATATMKASELTVLHFAPSGDELAPTTTEYELDHLFTFEKRAGQWFLVSDQVLNDPTALDGNPEEAAETVPIPSNAPSLASLPGRRIGKLGPLPALDSASPEAAATATLSRSAIVNYAYKYAKNYNSSYRRWSADCTNFVSQAVRAGGWADVNGLYTSSSYWWYSSLNQTTSWINAHYWFWFTYNRPRGTLVSSTSALQTGDILQADWTGDGTMDHTMIITKKDSNGNLYLTYHSNDTVDKPFADIAKAYPSARFYGWSLSSSPR